MKNKAFFMQECITLANKGIGMVSPNPLVGSVIVYKNRIIGEGYHEKYGYNHAEVNAINSVKDISLLKYSTLYVNLEPCSHYGKTPPCSNLIIENNISQVVVGCVDTFSKVSGKGIVKLREAGIDVTVGILEKESKKLNKRFFTFHSKKRPYIILKWAESKDHFIAPKAQAEPFWMTSSESKLLVHQWRAEEDSILVGRITAEKDNPDLTVRKIEGNNPIRIIIDRNLQLSKDLNLFNSESKTIIFNTIKTEEIDSNYFIKVDFNNLINNIISELYKRKVHSVIIEGGTKTLQSFIDINMWDEARIFTTKKILKQGIKAPTIKNNLSVKHSIIGTDLLRTITNK